MSTPSKMTAVKQNELCKIFKLKVNGTTIFPNLHSMIKNYKSKWKKNSVIVTAEKAMKIEDNELLKNLLFQFHWKIQQWHKKVQPTKHQQHNEIM